MNSIPLLTAELMDKVNKFNAKWSGKNVGTLEVIYWTDFKQKYQEQGESEDDFKERMCIESHCDPTDSVVSYDMVDDELDDSERTEFSNEFYDLLHEVDRSHLCPIADFDGSGDGLYYGFSIYR